MSLYNSIHLDTSNANIYTKISILFDCLRFKQAYVYNVKSFTSYYRYTFFKIFLLIVIIDLLIKTNYNLLKSRLKKPKYLIN